MATAAVLVALVVGLHFAIAANAGGAGSIPRPPAAPSANPVPAPGDLLPLTGTASDTPAATRTSLPCPDDVLCSDSTTCTTADDTGGQADDSASCSGQSDCSSAATSDAADDSNPSCPGGDFSP